MTNRIDRLEARGFVKRVSSATDGRKVLVTLTKPGRVIVDAALADHATNDSLLVGRLTPAMRRQLEAGLRQLAVVLETASGNPGEGV